MQLATRHAISLAVLAAALVPVLAQASGQDPTSAEAETHARRLELQRQIGELSAHGARDPQVQDLTDELERLSDSSGGDRPAQGNHAGPQAAAGSIALLAVPPACGFTPSTGSFPGTIGGIGNPAGPGTSLFTVSVAGAGTYLWDVNLNTEITHLNVTDLDIFLTSPGGTTVTITTDNGGSNDHVYNGTLWDDNVNVPVTDFVFTNLVAATPLSPEGRLQAFRGENPNGTWTLTVQDDATGNVGTLTSWSLDISTLAAAPVATTTPFPKVAGLAIGPGVATTTDTVAVSGVGTYLMETELSTSITHTVNNELDVSLASPGGPPVVVTTDNGLTLDNAFNGTLFDVDAPIPVADAVYVNLVAQTAVSPEGAFDNWLGQDPNGVWTLTVVDDAASNGGNLADWAVTVTTIPAPLPSALVNYPGTGGPLVDSVTAVTSGTFVFTSTVSGLPTSLWDLDLNTAITHGFSNDLDVTLTSPAGTVVVVTTDNGSTLDDVYNGTLWDDNANAPATDFAYTNAVAATPLSPEGRFSAFRGENPNGVWTLTIVDDLSGGSGDLSGWSLNIAALPVAVPVSSNSYSQAPGLAIPDLMTVSDILTVVNPGTSIVEVELTLEILHTECGDLDITLTSPMGTIVTVTTDNGGVNDNVFNGSLFDPGLGGAVTPVTDALYVNLVAETPISPEGSFDNFLGQNPNGNWTLTVTDDFATDVGTLLRWGLTIRTCTIPAPVAYCFGDGSGTLCPCMNGGAIGNGCANVINVNGANLTSTGLSSVTGDTLKLLGSGMTNSYVLYFQGSGPVAAGLGTTFGDGLRCANGTQVRLGTHLNALGASMHPNGNPPISVAGAVAPGNTRHYQGWYRDANPVFCPFPMGDTFNLTNGLTVFWAP